MTDWNLNAAKVPTRKLGRTQTSILQLGWWQAGGPPYFAMPDVNQLVEVRKICAERGVTHDCAPAYGKGMSEMLMYLTYCYLEPAWREQAGLEFRKQSDSIFSKCGLYWPRDGKMGTHADMHRSPDKHFGKPAEQVTGEEVCDLVLHEFEESCIRMGVEFINGYMLHWPLAKGGATAPAIDWMVDGVVPAFAQLWKEGKVGAVGFANINLEILAPLQQKAKELATTMGPAGEGFQIHFIQNDRSMLGIDVHGGKFGARDTVTGELAKFCVKENIARMAYSSLGHGPPIPPAGPFVFVDHWSQSREQQLDMYNYRKDFHQKFAAMAKTLGCSSPQMGLAWLMSRELIPVFSATIPKFLIDDIESVNFIEAVRQADTEIEVLCEEYRQGLWAIIRRYGTGAKW